MAKKLDTSACTATIGFPPKQGTWDFLQQAHQEEVAAVIQGLIGPAYSATTVYVLWGIEVSGGGISPVAFQPGAIYYNGEVFQSLYQSFIESGTVGSALYAYIATAPYTINPVTSGPANADPVQFAGTGAPLLDVHNVRTCQFAFGIPPSDSIGDVSTFVYLNNLQTITEFLNNETGSLAAAFGSPAGTFVPVIMSGLVYSTTSGGTLTAGGFYYNGLFYYCSGFHDAFVSSAPIQFTLSVVDGLPTASAAYGSAVTPGATGFNYTAMISWSTAVGITAINTAITTLQNEVSFEGAWYVADYLEFGTGWAQAGSGAPLCRFIRDGMGRVYMQGRAVFSGTSGDTVVIQFPSLVYAPSQNLSFPVTINSGTLGAIVSVTVNTSGQVICDDLSTVSTLDLSGIMFLTL